MGKEYGGLGRALRRGGALGLALTALGGVGLTADLDGWGEALARVGEQPALAVSLMRRQLGPLPEEEALYCNTAVDAALGEALAAVRPAAEDVTLSPALESLDWDAVLERLEASPFAAL